MNPKQNKPKTKSQPPNADIRHYGLELEFTGLDLKTVAELVVHHFGGEISKRSAYIIDVKNTAWGDFRLECDSSFLKSRGYADWLSNVGVDLTKDEQERLDVAIAGKSDILVPNELVTPPLPQKALPDFYNFVDHWKQIYRNLVPIDLSLAPLGLHINIETHSLESDWLLSVLRSFCLRYKSLKKEIAVDIKRSVAPYIASFPKGYTEWINREDYTPTMEVLIKDYFKWNPTRNRALDMAPLFGHINWELLEKVEGLELHLVKPRPAFHYRLPNCHLHSPDWSVEQEVNRWLELEDFAKTLSKNKKLGRDPQNGEMK